MKKFLAKTAPFVLSLAMLTACNTAGDPPVSETSETTSSAAETVIAALAETAAETEETPYTDPYDISAEGLSDYDKMIRLSAKYAEVFSRQDAEFLLYDLNLDGIPELLEFSGEKDTLSWEVYEFSEDKHILAGNIRFSMPPSRYKKEECYPDGLTLESGVHIYRDRDTGEIFYVTEYTSELHTEGFARGVRYDLYSDTLAETVLYDCRFDTWDDCGASGNRYIYLNVLDGKDAQPMYRVDSQAEGFRFCEGFADYLSQYEYLGMIDDSDRYCKERDGNFFDYAAKVKIPEKTKESAPYFDTREMITVCGQDVYKDAYDVELEIGVSVVDLSELLRLENLRELIIIGRKAYDIDISPLAEIKSLKALGIYGEYISEDGLAKLDQVERLSYNMSITAKTAEKMKSLKSAHIVPDDGETYSTLDLGGCKKLEVVKYSSSGTNAPEEQSIKNAEENFPDILFIYVP